MKQNIKTQCYIGFGSNLNQPLQQLNNAKNKLSNLTQIKVLKCSSIYQSKAITLDGGPQNDYLNAVVKIETSLDAETLLDILQQLEIEQGRVREKRWGARTLDLDILLFGDQKIKTARLTVPHNEIENRYFVLLPLFEIAPDIKITGKDSLQSLLEKTNHQALKKMNQFNE